MTLQDQLFLASQGALLLLASLAFPGIRMRAGFEIGCAAQCLRPAQNLSAGHVVEEAGDSVNSEKMSSDNFYPWFAARIQNQK